MRPILSWQVVPLALSAYGCLVYQEIEIDIHEELLACDGMTHVGCDAGCQVATNP